MHVEDLADDTAAVAEAVRVAGQIGQICDNTMRGATRGCLGCDLRPLGQTDRPRPPAGVQPRRGPSFDHALDAVLGGRGQDAAAAGVDIPFSTERHPQ